MDDPLYSLNPWKPRVHLSIQTTLPITHNDHNGYEMLSLAHILHVPLVDGTPIVNQFLKRNSTLRTYQISRLFLVKGID